jgi:hypothetical protein
MQTTHGNDLRMAANKIARRAGRDLEALQTSPELTQAEELTAAKVQELNQAKNLLYDSAAALGDDNPNGTIRNPTFISALATVQQDEAGKFIFQEKE